MYPRLYAYPKTPDLSGGELILLDSGAFALSLMRKSIDDAHMEKLAAHYAQYKKANVVPIAPDVFLNPSKSMENFKIWHERYKIPVAPVIQMRQKKKLDAYAILKQMEFYKKYPLPTYNDMPVLMFSNAGWRAIEFKRYTKALALMTKMAYPQGVWMHNLGAGWNTYDISQWSSLGLFSSIDSIAWYTDAELGIAWKPHHCAYRGNAEAATEAAIL